MTLSMPNNPIRRAKERYWLLERRYRRLSEIARRCQINYSDGMASSLSINPDPRVARAKKIRGDIRSEQLRIERFVHKNGYTLA